MSWREVMDLTPLPGWQQTNENASLSSGAEHAALAQRTRRTSTFGNALQTPAGPGEHLRWPQTPRSLEIYQQKWNSDVSPIPPHHITHQTEPSIDDDSDSPLSSVPSDVSDLEGDTSRPAKRRRTSLRDGAVIPRHKRSSRTKRPDSGLPTPSTGPDDSASPSDDSGGRYRDAGQIDGDTIHVKPLEDQQAGGKRKSISRGRSSKRDPAISTLLRTGSGKLVKLVCNNCQRSDFRNAQGFINHCRQAHGINYKTHNEAATACGQPVGDSQAVPTYGSDALTTLNADRPVRRRKSRTSSGIEIVQSEQAPDTQLPSDPPSRKQSLPITLEVSPTFLAELSRSERAIAEPDFKPPYIAAPGVDPQLYILSKRLMVRPSDFEKPDPVGTPSVWADGRQALCETLPYFRAYQSGSYCSGGIAYSFMFDNESHERDYMDADVVLSHAGGGRKKNKATNTMVMQKDQTENHVITSVRESMSQLNPVAIITGDRNPKMPCRIPHPYCVLDWFKITHIWFEKSHGKTIIRYRFEKLHPERQSWWAAQGQDDHVALGSLDAPECEVCRRCGKTSWRVYLQGWMCLQPECERFWKLKYGSEPTEADLLYDPRFLKQHTPWPHSSEPQSLRPNLLAISSSSTLGQDVSFAAWKGLACPNCGRCSSREAWHGWICGNPNCSFTYSLPHTLIPPEALHDLQHPLSTGYALSRDIVPPDVSKRMVFDHNYRILFYELDGIEGFVAHFIANKTINEEAGGPDDMWKELQTKEIGLRRRSLGTKKVRGGMLTQHFLVNYGMPYKFIVATESRSFDDACNAIKATRSRLNWAANYATKGDHKEFNEVLALGYFEKQAIDYHDDGETGLGPTISTLSLGYPATMRLRMKAKHYNGVSKSGVYVDDRPIPGCLKYDERKVAYDELQRILDPRARRERAKTLPTELGLDEKTTGNAKDIMTLHLGHGDIIIMHGADIQRYFEHAVDPSGKLRFATTARLIDPDSLKPNDRPTYQVAPDDGSYDGAALPPVVV